MHRFLKAIITSNGLMKTLKNNCIVTKDCHLRKKKYIGIKHFSFKVLKGTWFILI